MSSFASSFARCSTWSRQCVTTPSPSGSKASQTSRIVYHIFMITGLWRKRTSGENACQASIHILPSLPAVPASQTVRRTAFSGALWRGRTQEKSDKHGLSLIDVLWAVVLGNRCSILLSYGRGSFNCSSVQYCRTASMFSPCSCLRPLRSVSSMRNATPSTRPPSCFTSPTVARAVPPVASRSSTTSTR